MLIPECDNGAVCMQVRAHGHVCLSLVNLESVQCLLQSCLSPRLLFLLGKSLTRSNRVGSTLHGKMRYSLCTDYRFIVPTKLGRL